MLKGTDCLKYFFYLQSERFGNENSIILPIIKVSKIIVGLLLDSLETKQKTFYNIYIESSLFKKVF